jgi:hypothetical protein
MRFFSKITFICNVCFLISIPLRIIENLKFPKGDPNRIIQLQPLEGTIVILGNPLAIIVNFIFVIISLYWILSGRVKQLPLWIVFFNLVLFPIQVFYFFI